MKIAIKKLEIAGIKVINNQIAKADVAKAVEVIAKNLRANWWVSNEGVDKVAKYYKHKIKFGDFDIVAKLPFGVLGYDDEEGLKFDEIEDPTAVEKYCSEMKKKLNLPKSLLQYY